GATLRQHDYPSIAADADAVWTTWSSFHDRQEELNFRRYESGRWTRLIPVGRASADLWRPNVTTDDTGKPWLIWSQQIQNNWDIYAMPWEDNESGPHWGKDLGAALGPKAPSQPLGGSRRIEIACFDGQTWKAPATFSPQDSLAVSGT